MIKCIRLISPHPRLSQSLQARLAASEQGRRAAEEELEVRDQAIRVLEMVKARTQDCIALLGPPPWPPAAFSVPRS